MSNILTHNKIKVLVLTKGWTGGTIFFFLEAFQELGFEISTFHIPGWSFFKKKLIPTRLMSVEFFKKRLDNYYLETINRELLETVKKNKPDILFVQNESDLLPETLANIKDYGVITVNLNGDYVFDSARYKYFPIMLKYFDYVFYGERIWLENYIRVAPKTKFIKTVGAFSEKHFFPLDDKILNERNDLNAIISFAGSAYGFKAEGHYRVELINAVSDLGLKIWGGDRWDRYFNYYPKLKICYQGGNLKHKELNILYQNSMINLNISNPQCFTSFQQRTFEIAAAKAFQIVDYKEEIFDYFKEDDIVTFKTQEELVDKCKYFIAHPQERELYINKAYERVISGNNTYKDRILEYIKIILGK